MKSKTFLVELPTNTDEFSVYEALKDNGLEYARVKPLDYYLENDDYSNPELSDIIRRLRGVQV